MKASLDQLKPGERGTVCWIALPAERAQSLTRLGLCPGTEILCLRRTPLGDPRVYRFLGTDVAIRQKDAAGIKVRIDRGQPEIETS
ncbi:MAG: ferrous iron transport protein A [Oscillospiraceae bacterium]|nr:ferrous iron transport protein A [Oscillospiraceae bacterium]